MRLFSLALAFVCVGCVSTGREGAPTAERRVNLAANAPADRPIRISSARERDQLFAMLEPCRRVALAAWPDVRRRFAAGLPARHTMFVTTRLRDEAGRVEQVFVAVTLLAAGRSRGGWRARSAGSTA